MDKLADKYAGLSAAALALEAIKEAEQASSAEYYRVAKTNFGAIKRLLTQSSNDDTKKMIRRAELPNPA